MLQKLIYFFFVWLFIVQRGSVIAGTARTRGHSDTEYGQLPDCELLSQEGIQTLITHRHTHGLSQGWNWSAWRHCRVLKENTQLVKHIPLACWNFTVTENLPWENSVSWCLNASSQNLPKSRITTFLHFCASEQAVSHVFKHDGKRRKSLTLWLSCSLAPGPACSLLGLCSKHHLCHNHQHVGLAALTAPSLQEECQHSKCKGRPRVPCFCPSCAASTLSCAISHYEVTWPKRRGLAPQQQNTKQLPSGPYLSFTIHPYAYVTSALTLPTLFELPQFCTDYVLINKYPPPKHELKRTEQKKFRDTASKN